MLIKLDTFDYKYGDISVYLNKIEQYFRINNITDDKKQTAIFLTVVGKETYSLLRILSAPDMPSTKSVKILSDKLKEFLQPKSIVIAERYKFYGRDQREGEPIIEYISDLRKLSLNCNFKSF